MIDYEKLKLAHELAMDARPKEGCIHIDCSFPVGSDGKIKPYFTIQTEDNNGMIDEFEFTLIDGLIAKLQSLVKPEPKYIVGDVTWVLYDDAPKEFYITSITTAEANNCGEYIYSFSCGDWFPETQLFPTRQALIEHQLTYWRNLLEDELEQHVSSYCEPKPDCKKCHNYRNANQKLDYDCCCDELVTEKSNKDSVITTGKRTCLVCNSDLSNYAALVKGKWITCCSNLKCGHQEIIECQHEPDLGGKHQSLSIQLCIKCGAFYQ